MKKLLYIFLTLSILSIGCSNDDDSVQPTNTTLSLDNNLIGEWYVENQLLYFSDWGYLIEYNISGNSLTLTELDGDPIGILTKQ